MAKNEMLWYAGGAVAAYFAYNYAVKQVLIPDYIGIVGKYPRNQAELDWILMKAGGDKKRAVTHLAALQIVGDREPRTIGQIMAEELALEAAYIAERGTLNITSPPDSGINLALQLQPQPTTVLQPSAPGGSRTADLIVGPINTLKDQLWEAAKGQIVPNQGRAHFWAWNYYLPDTLPRLDPFTMDPAAWSGTPLGRVPQNEQEVQNTLLTLDQYWAMVSPQFAAAGLSGLQGGVNHWGMQSSVWGNRSGYIQ